MAELAPKAVWSNENISTLEKGKFDVDADGNPLVRTSTKNSQETVAGKIVHRVVQAYKKLNKFSHSKTSITTAVKINIPEDIYSVQIIHRSSGNLLYISGDIVTANQTDGFPLAANEYLPLELSLCNENELYGFSPGVSIDVWAIGTVRE